MSEPTFRGFASLTLEQLQQETAGTLETRLTYAAMHAATFAPSTWNPYVMMAGSFLRSIRAFDASGHDEQRSPLRFICNVAINTSRALEWDVYQGVPEIALDLKFGGCGEIMARCVNARGIQVEDITEEMRLAVEKALEHFRRHACGVFGKHLKGLDQNFVDSVARGVRFLRVTGTGKSWAGCSSIGSSIIYLNGDLTRNIDELMADVAHELSHMLTRAWNYSQPLQAGASILAWNSAQVLGLMLVEDDYGSLLDDYHRFAGSRPVEAGQFYEVMTGIYDWGPNDLTPFCMKSVPTVWK
jgi:hypothetical protein